jgi:Arf-GAP/coiled-coil/ANK repeat/PH domain-containing protein
MQLLLNRGADVDTQMDDGQTALHRAAYMGRPKAVELLLDRGADPHARTTEGKSPFQVALESKYWDTTQVRRLLSERTGEKMEVVEMRD